MAISIIQSPASTSYVDNISDIVVQTDQTKESVVITLNGKARNLTYYPDRNGRFKIRLRELCREMLSYPFTAQLMDEPYDWMFVDKVSVKIDQTTLLINLLPGVLADATLADVTWQWLTVNKSVRKFGRTIPQFLQFYTYTAINKVMAEAEMQDGKKIVSQIMQEVGEQHILINCTWDMLAAFFGTEPAAITLWITDNAEKKLSEGIRFERGEDPGRDEHIFYYRNSVGAIECVMMRGEQIALSKTKQSVYETEWRERKTLMSERNRTYKKNTGFKSQKEMTTVVRDFFESDEHFLLHRGEILRIAIAECNYEVHDHTISDIEFTYEIIEKDQRVSLI